AAGALPLITTQPASLVVALGQPFTLSVVAAGTGLSYQWRKGGANIPGATSPNYTVNSATADDVGSYDVVVSNAFGSVTSAIATTTIQTAPAFANGPPPPATLGTPYSFTLIASGSPAPSFSLTAGALPPGLTLASNGLISGTPTAAGTYGDITVTASNGVP